MSNNYLEFVKVSSVHQKYCWLEVYLPDQDISFMEIKLSDKKNIKFIIFSQKSNIELTINQWKIIYEKTEKFVKSEIKNEEAFEIMNKKYTK